MLAWVYCFLALKKPIEPFIAGASGGFLKIGVRQLSEAAHLIIELWVRTCHYCPCRLVAALSKVLLNDFSIFVNGCNDGGTKRMVKYKEGNKI